MEVLLISGKARSGKDTFAEYFKKYAETTGGKKVLIIKYADILKFVCKEYFGWNGKKNNKGRELLQHVGTDLCRTNNENVWVNCVIELVKSLSTEYDYVVIPDTRFPNEIFSWDNVFKHKTIRIGRINEDGSEYDNELPTELKEHISETALDKWNFNYQFNCVYVNEIEEKAKEIFEKEEIDNNEIN